jgi:hypothetical protein
MGPIPLWFWQYYGPGDGISVQRIEPPHVPDPQIFGAGEEAGKSFSRQRANAARHLQAQLTPEQLQKVAEYPERHAGKLSKRQAEKDLGIPRRKIKWSRPTP